MTNIFSHFEYYRPINSSVKGYCEIIWTLYHPTLFLVIPLIIGFIYYTPNKPLVVVTYPKVLYNTVYNHWYNLVSYSFLSYYPKIKQVFLINEGVEVMAGGGGFVNLKLSKKFTNLFLLLFIINLFGLVPATYCFTTWLSCTMAVSLSLWLMTLFYTLYNLFYLNVGEHYLNTLENGAIWLANFFPAGTPLWLAPVIVPIELISYAIRPVSMGLRICGNLVAGHILMGIIWNVIVATQVKGIVLAMHGVVPFILYLAMFVLELGVSLVQAYVLTLLAVTFMKEAVEIH